MHKQTPSTKNAGMRRRKKEKDVEENNNMNKKRTMGATQPAQSGPPTW
jgi:hypothetical protein